MRPRPVLLAVSLAASAAAGQGPPPIDPEDLIRAVARSQSRVEAEHALSTFDQRDVQTTYDGKGRPKETVERVWWVSSEADGERSRELAFVDGRAATDAEKREAAEEDAKSRKKRIEQRAARTVRDPPRAGGPEDDPLVGARRLSELMSRYEFEMLDEDVEDGRPVYRLIFSPRPGVPVPTLTDRALAALAGTVTIDASDLQVRRVDARLVRSVKLVGGLAANVKSGAVVYEGAETQPGRWAPCRVELRVVGRKAIFARLDASFRSEFANFRTFEVDVETRPQPPPPAGSAP